MRNRGFTFIEVIVAMTIVSIMAGILVPITYRILETQEESLTLERMASLKKAMVGDPDLYQQGIRTDYGFVGDHGELPELLSDLIVDNGTYSNWQGPYLGAGFDPDRYARDAWGNGLLYTTSVEAVTGRYQSATLVSKGPDRILGTADDLDQQITSEEVLPAEGILSNLSYSVSNTYNAAVVGLTYSARVTAYQDVGGPVLTEGDCVAVNVDRLEAESYSGSISAPYNSAFPETLPVGKVVLAGKLYKNADCSGVAAASTSEVVFFVNAGMKKIFVNLRFPPIIN